MYDGGGGGGLVGKSCPTLATPWTVAHQAPLSMGFSRQEYWSGLPFPSPSVLPNSGIEPRSPALQADALTSEPPGKQLDIFLSIYSYHCNDGWNCFLNFSVFSLLVYRNARDFCVLV